MERLARICSYNPAVAFNLRRKGALAVGRDADIVLVDMKKKWKITAKNRLSKFKWTPFEGKEVYGKIEKVLLRGKLAYDGENVVAKKGQGKEII
jgi:dihydroorotase-like cyclic amidohydrolase